MGKNSDDPSDCSNIIIIDMSRIPKNEYPSWVQNNGRFFASPAAGGVQQIDTTLIPEEDFARWLVANQHYIVFELTYPYIECMHLITDPKEIEMVTSAPVLDRIKFSDFIEAITKLGTDFSTPNYDNYISMLVDVNNRVRFSLANIYNCDSNCFSIPMFRSILHNNPEVTHDSELVFKMPDGGRFAGKKITISIAEPLNFTKNYNFSQFPP